MPRGIALLECGRLAVTPRAKIESANFAKPVNLRHFLRHRAARPSKSISLFYPREAARA
jgi:hypothetical protein